MSYRRLPWAAFLFLVGGCFSETPRPERTSEPREDRAELGAIDEASGGPVRVIEVSQRAVLGVTPSHGTYVGGNLALIRGNGFGSGVRVWFGESEVPEDDVFSVDAQRVQVTVPEGSGRVDVHVQDGDDSASRATLQDGYQYDPFVVDPPRGITRGGSAVTLLGRGTSWDEGSEVTIDLQPCVVTSFREQAGLQILVCETPPGSEGAKNVQVTTDGAAPDTVLGAFTYANTVEVLRGGLAGDELDDEMTVVALDASTSLALEGATVLLGDGTTGDLTDAQGVAQLSGSLGPRQTVTVIATCHHPLTFVDVPVSQVVAPLDPILSPACIPDADPPALPTGSLAAGATITGQLVWAQVEEFRTSGWFNVPTPEKESERRVAYVFEMSSRAQASFALPRATQGVTPFGFTDPGYSFVHGSSVGNLSLYALAGVEDRTQTPPRFTPFVMGITRGVSVSPGEVVSDVFIRMDIPLEQRLQVDLVPPVATERGPNRIDSEVRVRVGSEGYLLLPGMSQRGPADATSTLRFLGLPALAGPLAEASYVVAANATSGVLSTVPSSSLLQILSSSDVGAVEIDGFVELPILRAPEENSAWDGRSLRLAGAGGGTVPQLRVIDLALGQGRLSWRVVGPGDVDDIELPALPSSVLVVPRGEVSALVRGARLDDFEYGSLSSLQLDPSRWIAHSAELFFFHH